MGKGGGLYVHAASRHLQRTRRHSQRRGEGGPDLAACRQRDAKGPHGDGTTTNHTQTTQGRRFLKKVTEREAPPGKRVGRGQVTTGVVSYDPTSSQTARHRQGRGGEEGKGAGDKED